MLKFFCQSQCYVCKYCFFSRTLLNILASENQDKFIQLFKAQLLGSFKYIYIYICIFVVLQQQVRIFLYQKAKHFSFSIQMMFLVMILNKHIHLIRGLLCMALHVFCFVFLRIFIFSWSVCCLSISTLATYCHICNGSCLLRVVTLLPSDQRIRHGK